MQKRQLSKDDIFHYVYAVLHDPLYREKDAGQRRDRSDHGADEEGRALAGMVARWHGSAFCGPRLGFHF